MNWSDPGRTGAVVYAVLGAVAAVAVAGLTRLRVAGVRGRRRAAMALPDGAVIVISNHSSYLDGILLALVGRRLGRPLRLLATAGVFRFPVVGGLARRLGYIPVERGTSDAANALEAAASALAEGEAIGIFPEGRTTRDPHQWPERAKTGAVRLALMSGAPIVPIAMVGAHRVLGRRRLVRSLIRSVFLRPEVRSVIGAPIDVWQLTDQSDPDASELRRLADLVMEQLIDLVEELRGEIAPDPIGVPRRDAA